MFLLKIEDLKKRQITELDFPKYFFEEPNELQLHSVYNSFCNHSEMNVYDFIKLLKCAALLTKAFTDYLAQEVFKEGMAKAEACEEGGPIRSGVLYGKRVRYDVFRRILLMDVANIKKISTEGIVAKVSVATGAGSGSSSSSSFIPSEDTTNIVKQNSAATIIQNKARQKIAKRKVNALKRSS